MVHDVITVTITDLSDKGEGTVNYEGYQIYVKGTVPSDVVNIECGAPFVKGSKRCPGKLLSLVKASPNRKEGAEVCPHFEECGGCTLGLLNKKAQNAFKQKLIEEALERTGIGNAKLLPFVGAPCNSLRSKSIRFFGKKNNNLVQGFYRSRSHMICPVSICPAEEAWFGQLAEEISVHAQKCGISAYDEKSRQGQLRALMMRDCNEGGRVAVLVHAYPLSKHFIDELLKLYTKYAVTAGFVQQNLCDGNRIMQGKMIALTSESMVKIKLGSFNFNAGPETFLQVNYAVAQELYASALRWCGEDKEACALDLCCGCGTMTLPLAEKFKKVIGVEIVEEAVRAARENAREAGLFNIEFIADDLKRCLPHLTGENIAAVIADPARSGLGAENCMAMKHLPDGTRLALIFCGLKALTRDLPQLYKVGFKLESVQGFDMFPETSGCETLCLLVKHNNGKRR